MKICILTNGFKLSTKSSLIFPFYAFKKELLNNKINFNITEKINKIKKNDVLIIDSKFFYYEYSDKKIIKTIKILKNLKKKTKKLVFFDTSDSTGPIEIKIIEHVDLYLKHQIFKKKTYYLKDLYGGRLYTDYYNSNHNIKDIKPTFQKKIYKSYLDKIQVGWNIGLSDYTIFSNIKFKIYKWLSFIKPKKFPKINYVGKKNIDFLLNFNLRYKNNTIGFQRVFLSKIYPEKIKKINFFRYFVMLKKSLVSVSPFGWGEINYRDFEAIISKTVLYKPDLDHIETWPNFFIKNKTYVNFNWDMNNFEKKLLKLTSNKKKCLKISTAAFQNYIKFTSGSNAGNLFAKRLIDLFG